MQTWTVPTGPDVYTIFYQGLFNSQTKLAQYLESEQGFTASTGEHVHCERGLPLLWQPWLGKELDEVSLCNARVPIALQGLQACVNRSKDWCCRVRVSGPNNGQTVRGHSTKLAMNSVGQANDQREHAFKVASAPQGDLILFGYSRGAAVTFCALAQQHYSRVRLAVLEAPFASLEDNCQLLWGWRWGPKVYQLGRKCFAPQHNPDFEEAPAAFVDRLPPGVPIAFIASKGDRYVHSDSVRRLAMLTAERKQNDVYLLTLQTAAHGDYTLAGEEDRRQYLDFVHALYERYHLPHISRFSEPGRALLNAHTLFSLT